MGKMKRMRQKLHIAATKAKGKEEKSKSSAEGNNESMMEAVEFKPPPDPTALGARGDNLFKDVKISSLELTPQKLPDFDARSTITSMTFKGQNLTKKEKHKIRHDTWLAKMDAISSAKKKAKDEKKRQQTPVVGDLTQMEEALPTLEWLMKKSTEPKGKSKQEEKKRSIPKEKKRKKQMSDDISLFHRVLEHPMFKEDAGSTIQTHLRNKIQIENDMET